MENKFNIEHEVETSDVIHGISNINKDRAFCWFIGSLLDMCDDNSITKIFTVIDVDKNQSLDAVELFNILIINFKDKSYCQELVKTAFECVDVFNLGALGYLEFKILTFRAMRNYAKLGKMMSNFRFCTNGAIEAKKLFDHLEFEDHENECAMS